jgi:hypothetical protein
MPRKVKPRKSVPSREDVWIAPRPASAPAKATILEPPAGSRPNRYLEFADIALGTKHGKSKIKTKKAVTAIQDQHEKKPEGKVTSMNNVRLSNRGLGAFRNPR